MTDEYYEKLMITWIKEFQQIFEGKYVTPITLYNTYQTSLFYQKLKNSVYIEKKQSKYFARTKATKEKTGLLQCYDLLQTGIDFCCVWL